MQEFAIYSVIPPEGCAAILWRDAAKKVEAAEALKLTAPDLLKAGIIDEIVRSRSAARTPIPRPRRLVDDALTRVLAEISALRRRRGWSSGTTSSGTWAGSGSISSTKGDAGCQRHRG